MKKISIVLALFLAATLSFAQKANVNAASSSLLSNKVDLAKESIDKDLVANDPETAQWDKAWYVRGQVYRAIAEDITTFFIGLDPDPVPKAYDAFLKALEFGKLDKNKYEKKILEDELPALKPLFINRGVDRFGKEDFAGAYESFNAAVKIDELTGNTVVDTVVVFYAGRAAHGAQKYNEAIEQYNKVLNLGFGDAYYYRAMTEKAMGDTVKAENTLKEGIKNSPENAQFLYIELINIYLVSNQNDKAVDLIDLALETEPNNPTLYYAKGIVFNKTNQSEKEIEEYKKALEKDPTHFASLYNMAAAYMKIAQGIYNEANALPPAESAKYNELDKKAKQTLLEAEPYLLRAHEIAPDDVDILISLREIYAKNAMYEKVNEIKAKIEAIQE